MTDVPFVSLYRRFRPGRFDQLRGQDHVVRALQSAVREGRVSHAYLFSGPRGTGKTSSARILAKALNCLTPQDGEPCGTCISCTEITLGTSLNVHELDAASNNGVDAMRDLVAHASLGTPGRWKVYIVDEVHMLSTAAANALLKTLEEPPSHVVFVLATTDPQKVPPTIKSRTQHLEFRLLPADTLHDLLTAVVEGAGLHIDDVAVQVAVRRARGSARDALSALDQVAASGSVDAARPDLTSLVDALSNDDTAEVLVSLSLLLATGWGAQQLATELVDDLRQIFLTALAPELSAVTGQDRDRFTALARAMTLARVVRSMVTLGTAIVDMRDAPDAQVVLEIALVRAVRPDLDLSVEALTERVASLERAVAADTSPAPGRTAPSAPVKEAKETKEEAVAPQQEEVASRPSVGAVRRRKEGSSGSDPQVEDQQPPKADETVTAETPRVAMPSVAVDRDSLSQAWGDGILRGLPARAKALFSAGRFVAVDAQGAQFALPNAAHRDRCAELAALVETSLATHFGHRVPLVLVVDEGQTGGGPDGSPADPDPSPSNDEGALAEDDPAVFRTSATGEVDQAVEAEARLLQAFPGTSEVTG